MQRRRWLFAATFASYAVVWSTPADAAPESEGPSPARSDGTRLESFTNLGYLGSPGASGAAFGAGLRLGVGRHFAASFDLGYGLLGTSSFAQDRWWLIPSVALVLPAHVGALRATFDLGAGFGLGTASGYTSLSSFGNAPFSPVWAFQLFPTARVHAIGAVAVNPGLDVFLRADAASLLMTSSGYGAVDTTWIMFSLGARFRVL